MFVYICQSAVVAAPYYRKRADALPQLHEDWPITVDRFKCN